MITEQQEREIVERVRVAIPEAQEIVLAPIPDNPTRRLLSVKHPAGRCGIGFYPSEDEADDIVMEIVRTYWYSLAQNQYEADLAKVEEAFERDKMHAQQKYDEMKLSSKKGST
jgi:hypothetical protein